MRCYTSPNFYFSRTTKERITKFSSSKWDLQFCTFQRSLKDGNYFAYTESISKLRWHRRKYPITYGLWGKQVASRTNIGWERSGYDSSQWGKHALRNRIVHSAWPYAGFFSCGVSVFHSWGAPGRGCTLNLPGSPEILNRFFPVVGEENGVGPGKQAARRSPQTIGRMIYAERSMDCLWRRVCTPLKNLLTVWHYGQREIERP